MMKKFIAMLALSALGFACNNNVGNADATIDSLPADTATDHTAAPTPLDTAYAPTDSAKAKVNEAMKK